ncbi:MAG: hypothetical protein ACM3X9_02405 [Bacillota bacterium]
MKNSFNPKQLNPQWDSLLTSEQKQILVSQGLGLWHQLPYLEAELVKEIMEMIEKYLREIEAKINQTN